MHQRVRGEGGLPLINELKRKQTNDSMMIVSSSLLLRV
jgi:hypothetical protein